MGDVKMLTARLTKLRDHIANLDSGAGEVALLTETITALASQAREGWKLVPAEPTEAMLDKGAYTNSEWLNDNAPIGQSMYREPAKAVYKAMITAAPEAT